MREFVPGREDETTIRAGLAGKIEKITFPVANLTADSYLTGFNEIIAQLTATTKVDLAVMPICQSNGAGASKTMPSLYVENIDLKKQLA